MIRRMTTKGTEIARQLWIVQDRINAAAQRRPEHLQGKEPRLVAVTKTKPAAVIIEAYVCGQRHFGENYVKELAEKANNPEILQQCPDIKWHFIGHLQRNKVNKVTSLPGLYMIETLDSEKVASTLNSSWGKQSPTNPLAVMLQVNTSSEESKNGIDPDEVEALAQYVQRECPHLHLAGLMTIGSVESSTADGQNTEFQCLLECRKLVSKALDVAELDLELSMGMSQDFEHAIEVGSTNVRVGSTIFGARQSPASQPDAAPTQIPVQNGPSDALSTTGSGDSSVNQCISEEMTVAATKLNRLHLAS